MKLIPLTQEQFAKVSDHWFKYLSQWEWSAQWNRDTQSYYAMRKKRIGGRVIVIHMSRIVANTPDGMVCDHKNHDTLDNQDHNLRNVTYSQNNMNSRPRKNNQLGERCIRLHNKKYNVRISKNSVFVFDKHFDTLEEAKLVRDSMLIKIHGEFSYQGDY